ncbi:MAG TPA: UDP-N-acetylmuramoyl-L-alanine--D-glutamate ligase [Candidatus Omnitrophota bacterium]|nr:UDP-N-acetylmuramoyl-L-alanine--D-glutamate ligase [Candidatus Omnitrophota bacterium]HRY85287.1 UDP-N-acetylmuramoyl-L-alanine--D-glutamate ligase [Candidatus Omnitrophota bacterium]
MKPASGTKVAILGLRDTGTLSAFFLHEKGYKVFASDLADSQEIRANLAKLSRQGIRAECGKHSFDEILAADWILISPGIPPNSEIFRKIRAKQKPVYSEIEVASWFSPAKTVIAVTGSCGKTTTATLISRIVQANGCPAVLCGNIGNPWIGELPKIRPETVVALEVSSFQLMHCASFAPSIGLLLNAYPNHMDWHADMNEYVQAKLNLFRWMKPANIMICRKEDETRLFPDFRTAAKRVYFDQRPASNPNEAALLCVAEALGYPASAVQKAVSEFGGLEHRLEKFEEKDGVIFINDSKATTTASLAWALEKFSDRSVILICGGKYKTDVKDFMTLRDIIRRKVRCAILIGAARPLMREAWQGAVEMLEAQSLEDASRLGTEKAHRGDTVLLSPACASFDMFKNYQERGDLFKALIRQRLRSEVARK